MLIQPENKIVIKLNYNLKILIQTNCILFWVIEVEGNCQNCGKLLEDSFLTHCSMKCSYEDYLKSQSSRSVKEI